MLELEKPFPDFTLPDQNGIMHTRSQYVGKWLAIYFYPKDNTSGCTAEALAFTAYHKDFVNKNAEIIGVSPDSVKSHANFAKKQGLNFTLLSDMEKELLEAAGVWQQKKMYGREYMGVVRSTVLVDPKGIVRHIWPKVKVDGHAMEVFETLEKFAG